MSPRNLPVETAAFPVREARSRYVAERFAPLLRGRVLDVGCFEAPLRALLPEAEYRGIDMAGTPDQVVDLDTGAPLPFADNAFDCVLCIDVLEHLEHLHGVFDELWRVSRKHILLSLPNCWRDARRPIERGRGEFGHYGLPVTAPVDRHRWFFSLTQAADFLAAGAERHGGEIVELFATEKPTPALLRRARRLRYPGDRYRNRYLNTLWCVLRKSSPEESSERP